MESFFFCEILCSFVNLVPSASFCKRKASKMGGDISGALEIQISQLFSEMGKIWKYSPGLFSKKTILHLYHKLGITEKSS